jgi:putative addiction module CopG family antidote
MNIALTPELEQFIEAQIATGAFSSATEVIHDGLRLLRQHTELKQTLQQGIADLEQGRYTTYTSAQDLATQIKTLGRQQQSTAQ